MRQRTLRRTLGLGGLGALLAAGALVLAPPAAADELAYINDLTSAGITPNDGDYHTLLNAGYAVCADALYHMDVSVTQHNLMTKWVDHYGDLSAFSAKEIIMAAHTFLC